MSAERVSVVHGPHPAGPLRLHPFRGVRYDTRRVGDLAAVTCPPYDVIGPEGTSAWERAHPYNVVRLILPHAPGNQRPSPQVAASRLRQWLASGVLVRDGEAALYVYEQQVGDSRHRGLLGTVSLHERDEGVILPHEDVFAGAVTGRRELMAATRANLEPILLLNRGGGAIDAVLDAAGCGPGDSEPQVTFSTQDGTSHRLWRLSDPQLLSDISHRLARQHLLIADGHHRYAAYLALRHEGAVPPDAAASGLALVVDADRFPPRLGGIHRSVSALELDQAVSATAGAFSASWGGEEPVTNLLRGTASGRFLLTDGQRTVILTDVDRGRLAAGFAPARSATWRSLDVAVLHEVLLPRMWGAAPEGDRVAFHHDAADAVRRARATSGIAVLLAPPALSDVFTVSRLGERMPRKSTSFGPKPRTGVVLRLLDR